MESWKGLLPTCDTADGRSFVLSQSPLFFPSFALSGIWPMRATGFLLRGDNIQLDRYVIAGHHSTVIQHLVIVDAPILAVDCEGRGKSDTQPRNVVLNLSVINKGDSYLVSHAMQAQASYEYQISAALLHTLARERHLWIFRDIQK